MDRIVIQLKNIEGQEINRLFLQQDLAFQNGIQIPHVNQPLMIADESDAVKAAYNALVSLLQERFDTLTAAPEKNFLVSVAISNDPLDATITRTANCDLVQMETETSFILPVLIKHWQNGIRMPKLDYVKTLRASNEREIEVNGQVVKEFDHFKAMEEQMSLTALLRVQLQEEDRKGNLNREIVVEAAQSDQN
jgi:hypothetical protein